MSEPYGVLIDGEWSVWCRRCSWRSQPRLVSSVDPLVFAAVIAITAAEWQEHARGAGEPEGAGRPIGGVGPAPSATFVEAA